MAALDNKYLTFLDLALMPANKDSSDMINMLAAFNPILEDALALPCNRGLFHETTVKTGLPDVAWARLYEGIPASKGTKQMIKDTPGTLSTASQVDCRLIDVFEKADEKASMMLEEAEDHMESMSQEAATAIFYHDISIDPSKIMGLSPRFNSFSAENASQVINGGGVGADNTSIWMVTWDKGTCHLIFPKNSQAGIKRSEMMKIPVTDAGGKIYMAYREEFEWQLGLTVRNWQYVSRVCNIDVSNLQIDAATGANIVNLLTEAYYAHKGRRTAKGRTCIYMNTTLVKYLDYQARLQKDTNLFLTFDKYGVNAKEILHFRGIPIRESDALLNSEAAVS